MMLRDSGLLFWASLYYYSMLCLLCFIFFALRICKQIGRCFF